MPNRVSNIYFTYKLINGKYLFSKVKIFNDTASIDILGADPLKNIEYGNILYEKHLHQKEVLKNLQDAFKQLPDSSKEEM